LAPLLTIGGATGLLLGILIQKIFPQTDINLPTCALIGMASMFAGATRALLTSIVFAFETTMQPNGLLPLLVACTASYFVSFFMMKGTIMTEKIERRGVNTPNAYEPDILQGMKTSEVMVENSHFINSESTIGQVREWLNKVSVVQNEFIVTNSDDQLMGMLFINDIYKEGLEQDSSINSLVHRHTAYVFADTKLNLALEKMNNEHANLLPVVTKENRHEVIGILTPSLILDSYRKCRIKNEQYQRTTYFKNGELSIFSKGKQFFKG
jgi:predicted transcriptional regulator